MTHPTKDVFTCPVGETQTHERSSRIVLAALAQLQPFEVVVELVQGPRFDHSATLLPSGKVLVAGGYSKGPFGDLTSAELYDPVSGTFTAPGNMSQARGGHTANLLLGGKVLVVGGYAGSYGYVAGAELDEPAFGTFTVNPALYVFWVVVNGVLSAGQPVEIRPCTSDSDCIPSDYCGWKLCQQGR